MEDSGLREVTTTLCTREKLELRSQDVYERQWAKFQMYNPCIFCVMIVRCGVVFGQMLIEL